MADEKINKWNGSTSFLIAMIGAIIGLSGIWKFSYLIYENGGGSFFIPYILAIVIMAIPLLVLEFGIGFKYKSSLPKIFYNIKSEFEIVAWFIVFLIFLVLIYYACIMSWDLIYVILSLFKGWGSNPSVFFTNTFLHSSSNAYGLTYLVVPIGIGLIVIWALIYLISRREINKGIGILSKISVSLSFVLLIGLLVFSLQLPGSRTGVMALFNPNWEFLLDAHVWIAAFGQIIFSYGLAFGIATTYSSYIADESKLIDNAWIIVLISLIFEVLVSVLIFAILGFMALGKNIPIRSLVSDGFSLIFVVFPNVFNVMGSWVYLIAPLFFLLIFIGGFSALLALIEPLSKGICEKFGWSKNKTLRTLVLLGLFSSFLFATGMGEYLLAIVDSFISQFAIFLFVLIELLVIAWAFDLGDIKRILNSSSFIKLDKSWEILIRFIIPIIILIVWIFGIYSLIISGDRQSLLIQSVLASLMILVPLALTLMPIKGDFYLDLGENNSYNYFKDNKKKESQSKSRSTRHNDKFKSRSKDNFVDKTIDDFADNPAEEDKKESKIGFASKLNGLNVLRNVDLSSEEFDSPYEDDYDEYHGENSYNSDRIIFEDEEFEEDSTKNSKASKSLFDKINLFNKDKGDADNSDNLDLDGLELKGNSKDYGYGEDDDYIAPIASEKDSPKQHKFRSSRDLDGFEDLEDLSSADSPKPKRKKSKKSSSKVEDSKDKKPKSKKSKSKKSKKEKEEVEIEYDDFTDDFFDDGIFGDEGYESLLDDYVPPTKKESKSKSRPKKGTGMKYDYELEREEKGKSSPKSLKRKSDDEEEKYYDFEGKGADSVFNLDD
ncbi:hypothetical protein [uncultured Methanobrevibacter sp.]|uniref:hypothetical protein n=1 Tax=uncultured Methanobrevibacter sp. TaxID=253161 RepID=UPI002617CC7C